ncbi:RNA polymerase sigma factor [Schumannella sp. 10F1B-5-1]|uniref:RNA polymerase sigma factor n=1 Tax=Schumannella sp. 10F1B-5-1 TaxID=2590780 RepID=UPI001130D175|nr:RNA polymerase sigma factor [Schumannella sp. 10F1B-5-1]TPW77004.1 RNA polymerase sigma factor [Schumannella sp. 10F1B-5-1]
MTRLTEESAPRLLAYFLRRVESREDAADLVAETLVVAWRRVRSLPTVREERILWLFGVAANVLSNHRRATRRSARLAEKLRATVARAVEEPATAEALDVRAAIASLTPDTAELIRLVHWEGFTIAEASSVLGVSPSTGRSRYAAAKAALRARLSVDVDR